MQEALADYWQVLKHYHAAPVAKRPHLLRNQVWLRWRGETHERTRDRLRAFIDTEHVRLKRDLRRREPRRAQRPGRAPRATGAVAARRPPTRAAPAIQGHPHLKVIADACPLHGREMWRLPT